MYKNKRFGRFVDSNQLPQRQRWGSIIGGVIGVVIGIWIADHYVPDRILNFITIMVFAGVGNFAGLYVTRPK